MFPNYDVVRTSEPTGTHNSLYGTSRFRFPRISFWRQSANRPISESLLSKYGRYFRGELPEALDNFHIWEVVSSRRPPKFDDVYTPTYEWMHFYYYVPRMLAGYFDYWPSFHWGFSLFLCAVLLLFFWSVCLFSWQRNNLANISTVLSAVWLGLFAVGSLFQCVCVWVCVRVWMYAPACTRYSKCCHLNST